MQKTFLSFCLLLLSLGLAAQVSTDGFSLGTNLLFLEIGEKTSIAYSRDSDAGNLSTIIWSTSDESVATISNEGLVTAVGEGICTLSATYGNNQQRCTVVVGNTTGSSDDHNYVDLGLPSGTLWATTNIGADSPEESGSPFQWRSEDGTNNDAAFVEWGAYWRTPSLTQFEELVDANKCDIGE